jgi:protein BUR2
VHTKINDLAIMPAAPDTATSSGDSSRETPILPRGTDSQWLFTEAELLRTPSILDGLPPEKERENRAKGVNFILQVGIMLKLPQITLATASVFLHRFFMRHSMSNAPSRPGFHYYSMAATSLFLATKVEENCRKMKELVVACVRVAQKDPNKVVDEQDREFWRWKDNILHNEDLLLEAICFDLNLDPPYKALFELLVFFGEENNKRLRNAAWAFVNDSYLTMLCLLFSSRTIAASALYAAAKHCAVGFPDDSSGRAWWNVLDVDLKSIRKVCNIMADMYESAPSRGARDGGIYERTPENGDEAGAKTRERSGNALGPLECDEGDLGVSPTSVPRPLHGGVKRGRDDAEGHISTTERLGNIEIVEVRDEVNKLLNGDPKENEKAIKRLRLNGGREVASVGHKTPASENEQKHDQPDDVSEEGEVES